MKPTATLLLEVDVVLPPEPGVGQVARVRLGLAGEECILGNVDGDVLWRRDDVGRPCAGKRSNARECRLIGIDKFCFQTTVDLFPI